MSNSDDGQRTFRRLLREYRQAAGLTQAALAERAGISGRAVQDLERGLSNPHRDTTERLISALSMPSHEHGAFRDAASVSPRRRVAAVQQLATDGRARSPLDQPDNLPLQLSSFIGREQEQLAIQRLLTAARLVTLTGTGGVGKTRLAIKVGATLAPHFADGVCFVDLAPLADPALVSKSVAAALKIHERSHRAVLDVLTDTVSQRHLLLILDNCEHLVQRCAELIDHMLRSCSRLTILATSRQVLRLPGERVWPVPSLRLPDVNLPESLEHTAPSDAVQLFVERAHACLPGFVLTEQNAPAVASICRRLDGIPLALELAAARTAVLGTEDIAIRLSDRFELLASGSRTALPRQQTLRGTLDWSYELLSQSERILLRRLAVFNGGWTLEAAESVCSDELLPRERVVDVLATLGESSMLSTERAADGRARYRLLETVRQYALEHLSHDEPLDRLRWRHAVYYLDVAEHGATELGSQHQVAWLDRLELEHDNLRAGLAWSKRSDPGNPTWLRLAAALGWFWRLHSHFAEGRHWLGDALSARQLDVDACAESEVIARLRVQVLLSAGLLAFAQGQHAEAAPLFEEALYLGRRIGDRHATGWALHGLSRVASADADYRRTVALSEASLEEFREIHDSSGSAYALYFLASALGELGEFDRATASGEQSVALFRKLNDSWGLTWAVMNLARVAAMQGANTHAVPLFREALTLAQRVGTAWGVRSGALGLANIAMHHTPAVAARLLGAAEALSTRFGIGWMAADRGIIEITEAGVRSAVGEEGFASARLEGAGMSLDEVTAYALGIADDALTSGTVDVPPGARSQLRQTVQQLSPRELEVAVLAARGLSNREIAAALVISRRTADSHVCNALAKLGLHTRAQLAVWIVARVSLQRTDPP
jgi:predicted ATPase/DNA-binding CsgD family transcriptional regulator/DNA-binding XRE family transcriptional regulator